MATPGGLFAVPLCQVLAGLGCLWWIPTATLQALLQGAGCQLYASLAVLNSPRLIPLKPVHGCPHSAGMRCNAQLHAVRACMRLLRSI